ncbi:MAG: hypothetical protein R2941_14960 [Desulfobacterales bacterium]
MIRTYCDLLIILFFLNFSGISLAQSTDICQEIGADLRLPMPCVEFQDVQYSFDMEYFQNPSDTEGLYWKIDLSTLTVKELPYAQCLTLKNNLKIYAACMEYEKVPYRFVLSYAPDAHPEALAWKMEVSTFPRFRNRRLMEAAGWTSERKHGIPIWCIILRKVCGTHAIPDFWSICTETANLHCQP